DRILTGDRVLISEEEEQLVLDYGATDSPAELIPLEGIASGREEVARVHIAVAEIFEQVAVEAVGSRLRDAGNRPARMDSVLRRKRSRFYLLFLKRMGKGMGDFLKLPRIFVHAATKPDRNPESLPAGDDELLRARKTAVARNTLLNHRGGILDQIGS